MRPGWNRWLLFSYKYTVMRNRLTVFFTRYLSPRALLLLLGTALIAARCSVQRSPITGQKRAYAYTALADAEDDEGRTYSFHIRAVEYGEEVYRFLSYTLSDRFSA